MQKKPQTEQKGHKTTRKERQQAISTPQITGLQKERAKLQQDIKNKQKEYKNKENDVRNRLDTLVKINTDIDQKQKTIDTIQSDIKHIDGNIDLLKGQLSSLEAQLGERRAKFIQSMQYMARHRSIQDKLMFIFSAKSLTQMYRRLRFVRQYAAYQRAQGEALQKQQELVDLKHSQLKDVRGHKSTLLHKREKARDIMADKRNEQETVVASLQQEQSVLQNVIAQQQQKQHALDAQIDRLVSIEIEKARARAAAEAKARAAAHAAAQRQRAAAQARARAAAQATERENAKRIAAAKEREAKAKAEAQKARIEAERARQKALEEEKAKKREKAEREAQIAAAKREKAEQKAREAEASRMAAERKAAVDNQRAQAAAHAAEAAPEENRSTADRAMSNSFERNRGRLPMPLSGHISSHFGQYNVAGLENVRLSNSGINIKGGAGAGVRCVFNGEVSAVFSFSGTMVVMVRHGDYITVYANLKSVSVSRGQKVSTGQTIGAVGGDGTLQFQLRKGTTKLNPEAWLR